VVNDGSSNTETQSRACASNRPSSLSWIPSEAVTGRPKQAFMVLMDPLKVVVLGRLGLV
jgi:hypothetical protein